MNGKNDHRLFTLFDRLVILGNWQDKDNVFEKAKKYQLSLTREQQLHWSNKSEFDKLHAKVIDPNNKKFGKIIIIE